jgi:hypothetical protein
MIVEGVKYRFPLPPSKKRISQEKEKLLFIDK